MAVEHARNVDKCCLNVIRRRIAYISAGNHVRACSTWPTT